jgi:hypothetical protein
MPRYSSITWWREAATGLSHAKKRASVCNHSPIMRACRSRSAGQVCGKNVIDDVIRFDAERVLNDLGGLFAVVTVDGSSSRLLIYAAVTTDVKPPR